MQQANLDERARSAAQAQASRRRCSTKTQKRAAELNGFPVGLQERHAIRTYLLM